MRFPVRTFLAALLACACSAQEQKIAALGDLPLASGEVLRDCRVGYRTVGTLNATRSNAILFPTYLGGTSGELLDQVGPDRLVDPAGAFVILVDALGDGVSSSPSNSVLQPRMKFPRITVRDMVESQHRLLTQVLKLDHLKAVMGYSMGGMQTFQWVVSHPGFMDRAVAINGSPRLAPYDRFLWRTMNLAITRDAAWAGGDYRENPAREVREGLFTLVLSTPGQVNQEPGDVEARLAAAGKAPGVDANDHIRQSEAMLALDVAEAFGSLERAAAAVRAKVLVVAATTDHTVTPGPALAFAGLLRAQVLVLDSPHGHGTSWGEDPRVPDAVRAFLKAP